MGPIDGILYMMSLEGRSTLVSASNSAKARNAQIKRQRDDSISFIPLCDNAHGWYALRGYEFAHPKVIESPMEDMPGSGLRGRALMQMTDLRGEIEAGNQLR